MYWGRRIPDLYDFYELHNLGVCRAGSAWCTRLFLHNTWNWYLTTAKIYNLDDLDDLDDLDYLDDLDDLDRDMSEVCINRCCVDV